MRRIVTILFLGSSLILAGLTHAQDETPVWETYLNMNDIRDLDYDGTRIWIATSGGAVAYEPVSGESRLYHRSANGLLSDSLSGVAHDLDGRVWFATERVGISILQPGSEVWEPFTSLLRPIPGDQIQKMSIVGDTLFVGTSEGLAVFVGGDQTIVCQEGIDLCGLPSFDVRDLVSAPDGDGIWAATAAGVAHRDSVGGWTTHPRATGSSTARRLLRHRGEWIALYEDGLFRLDPESGEWISYGTPAGGVIDLLSDGEVLLAAGSSGVWSREAEGSWVEVGDRSLPARTLMRTPDGRLWLGASDPSEILDGLWFLSSGDEWTQVRFDGPSLRAHYRALAFNSEGILFLSHSGSGTVPMVQGFDGSDWSTPLNTPDWVFDILFSPNDDLWLGQCCCKETGCSLSLVVDGSIEAYPPRNLRDIVYDEDGNLWCASDHASDNEEFAEGIWFLQRSTGQWTQITVDSPGAELLRNRVRAILPSGRNVWIGYSDSGLHRWDIGPDKIPLTEDDVDWTYYSTEEASDNRRLISDEITRLAVSGDRIWVGTTAGLSLVDPTEITNIGSGFFGLPSPVVNDLIPLRDGGAWVATSDAGLTRMIPDGNGFRFVNYGPPALPHPNVEALALDPDGRTVWAGTTRGLARLTLMGGGETVAQPLVAYPNPLTFGCGDGVRLLGFSGIADGVVVDITGKIIRRFDGVSPGDLVWDGLDRSGQPPAPGLYWIRLASPDGMRGVGVGLTDGPCPSY